MTCTKEQLAYIGVSIIAIFIFTVIIIISRSKRDEYEYWLEEMQFRLGDDLTENDKAFLLPHIYNENHYLIEKAVDRYYELKTQQKCAE